MNATDTPREVTVNWRQIGLITAAALALYLGFRMIPVGGELNHMDFRVAEKGAIEFCDPSNPQFVPVVAVKSPVALTLTPEGKVEAGRSTTFTLTMRTSAGKPIESKDLLVAHTRKLHLLVVDPTLQDYQHLHPESTQAPGQWRFTLTPRRSGLYRIFADFTPAATGRGLYASVDVEVAGATPTDDAPPALVHTANGCRFSLEHTYLKARKSAELTFRVATEQGGEVGLEPIMGAFAHLVAFDEARSGFAHLHPDQSDLRRPPAAVNPALTFKVTIPQAGRYIVWAQVQIAGREHFAPFAITVNP